MKPISTPFRFLLICIILMACTKSEVNKQPDPVASFTHTASGKAPCRVDFAVISPLAGTNYVWDFGDGIQGDNTSSPSHIYVMDYHNYETRLSKANTTDTCKKVISLEQIGSFSPQVPLPLDFSYKVTASPPYVVTFTNTSSNSVSATWDFGDNSGVTSNFPVVVHTYSSAGNFPVKLVVTNSAGVADSVTTVIQLNL